jgi:ribonuclease HI
MGRNIYILSESQANIKALDNCQTNGKFVCNCHQSLMRLAEHKSSQLVWMPGHMGIDGNEIADQLAKQASSLPPTGPQPAIGTFATADRVIPAG